MAFNITKIKSGSAQVIDSGLVFQFFNSPITLNLELPNFYVEIIFNFEARENKNTDVRAKIIDPNKLELTLINFDNSLGTGLKTPLKIADYHDEGIEKYIYLTFNVVRQSSGSDRYLMYTFFLSEELK